jgi:OHCU decarboxylase
VRLTVHELNVSPPGEAERLLLACCGSRAWAREVVARRPYRDLDDLLAISDDVWSRLTPDDWREAFAKHPRIGERAPSGGSVELGWSAGEQSRAQHAAGPMLADLATANARYEHRFGHVFLICATGKSAEEILAAAHERLHNDPERELYVAAEEQRQITHLRVRKLLDT